MNLEVTNWPDIKGQILRAILSDDLDKARKLIIDGGDQLSLIKDLLSKADNTSRPLKHFTAQLPQEITTAVSYTCGIGCQMCSSGFADRTSKFDDYKYVSPEQFDEVLPWLDTASLVVYVGTGETLDSPHIYDFVKKAKGKPTTLTTSGVSLTRDKVKRLIKSNLHTICFSFDGITSAGHGSGNEKYSKTILNRIDMVQATKNELGVDTPHIMINMVLNNENVDQLDEMVDLALSKNAIRLLLSIMTPLNDDLFKKSIFTDFRYYQNKINRSIARGNKKGLQVMFGNAKEIKDSQPCSSVDRMLAFNEDRYHPSVCCGPIAMPIRIKGESPENYWNSFPFRYFRYLHDQEESEPLPVACDTCWEMHPLKFAEKMHRRHNTFEAYPLYLEAGELKNNNQWGKAENNYRTIINETDDPTWKGKAYFHLAEQELRQKNYPKAYELLQLTVKNYYEHQLAFAYLYLLMVIVEENPEGISLSLEQVQCTA